ncbi:peptidoglycan-binding protein [Streptomyces sp. NBC_01104]|uniref:peptidoglycan-binding domain-containing protein n=1 Tax=Streptomyces sp. NBC_01104 TaxID=2903750 RepID=UPI003868BA57|nr:peptidoglycan-binding protein [Streptomyces sp. NBC_01104]
MTGHICPECGTDNRPGTGQGCACAGRAERGGAGPQDSAPGQQGAGGQHHLGDRERAAEQQRITERHHAERSAEMAAAEDFDPLRIRPYVTLGGEDAGAAADAGPHQEHAPGDAATTMPLFLDPAGPGPGPGPLPDALAPEGTAALPAASLIASGPDPVQPRRRKPFAALIAGAAVVAVVGTAAFVGGLFHGDEGKEADLDQALPSRVNSLPEESAEPSASDTASASASPSRSAAGPPSASASASASPSPSASVTASRSAPPSPSASAVTSSPSATAGSSAPAAVAPSAQSPGGPTLRRGDRGTEVAELQIRLQMVGAFNDSIDGDYTDRVERAVHDIQTWWGIDGDPDGVYGPHTRSTLEQYTPGAGRH